MSDFQFDGQEIRLSQEETRELLRFLRDFHVGMPHGLAHLQRALDRETSVTLDRFEQRELYEALYAAASGGRELPDSLARLRAALFALLSAEEAVIAEASEETFERDVVERSRRLPVVVYFWAPSCGPSCRVLAPVVEREVAAQEGRVALVRVDAGGAPDLATRLGVRTIPALRALVDGVVVDGVDGPQPRRAIAELIDRLERSER